MIRIAFAAPPFIDAEIIVLMMIPGLFGFA
jgi:hypothetical protein